jgi:tetratricopeptide (TPR) repeat protein
MRSPTGLARYLNLILMTQFIIFTGVVSAQTPSFTQIRELAAQTRYIEAHQQLELYLGSNPADEQARLLNGVLLTRLNRVNDAIKAFEQLANDNPQLPEPHNNLAVLFAAQGRFEDARRSLLDAIALQPNYDTARENLGDIYARLADIEYRQAHEINNKNTRAQRKANTISALFETVDDNTSTAPSVAASEPKPEPEPDTKTEPEPEPQPAKTPKQTQAKPTANTETTSRAVSSASICIKIANIINATDVNTMVSWLSKKGARVLHADGEENETVSGYQLYIPPLADKDQREQLLVKLKTAGVKDF